MQIKERKKEKKREETTRRIEEKRGVMELEKISAKLKWAIKKPREFDICHGLNKTSSSNYSASFLRIHQNESATILQILKKEIHAFTRNDRVFNEQEELGAGVFGVIILDFKPIILQRVAVKIFSEKLSQADILPETKIPFEMSGHPNFAFVFGITEPNKLLMEYIDGETLSEIVKIMFRFSTGKVYV